MTLLNDSITDKQIKKIFSDPVLQEAIFLASPSLFKECIKWINSDEENEKLKYTLLKYYSRMSSRCTPFGLFAGCALGEIGDKTEIEIKSTVEKKRHTRIDMNFLVAFSQNLVKNEQIREQLLFFPNSTIYQIGNKLRYVEYKYYRAKRHHQVTAVDCSKYLERIIKKAKKGVTLNKLIDSLVGDKITFEESKKFVEELVNSQLLVSELEPSVSGPEFLKQILSTLKKIDGCEHLVFFLQEIEKKIAALDIKVGNNPDSYIELSNLMAKLGTPLDLKFLFQTDLQLTCSKNLLDKTVVESVRKVIMILNRISPAPKETSLTKFKEAFYDRYEEREVPLSKALDVEIGVGYLQNGLSGDVNPLIDDLIISSHPRNDINYELTWNKFRSLMHEKLIKAYKNAEYSVTITDSDLEIFEPNWNNLSNTLSVMVEIVNIEGKEKIVFSGAGGSSAANILGRFCHCNKDIHNYVKSIISLETKMEKEKIHAEIVHLPESRVGNVLMRPVFRDYEIPYLAKSVLDSESQLPLDDLMVSVKNGNELILRSKKKDKKIQPYLTNAHNYRKNSLPVYQFLGEMQTQGKHEGLFFSLGPLADEYEFIPRIEYSNLILHRATWNIHKEDIEKILESMDNDDKFSILLKQFLNDRDIPRCVLLIDSDNELLIDLKNTTSAKTLFYTIRNREKFKLQEFLFDENAIVKSTNGHCTHQIILSFYNENKRTNLNFKK